MSASYLTSVTYPQGRTEGMRRTWMMLGERRIGFGNDAQAR
jgi:hypothetical protein